MSNRFNSRWTPEAIALLHKYHAEGKTRFEMHRLFAGRFSVNAIRHKLSRLRLVDQTRSEACRERRANEKTAVNRQCVITANVWHLIDLKRAGHSPTRTELNVSSFGPVRYSTPLADGVATSPAALCTEA